MLLVDDIHTLTNVVIANPTRTYLVSHVDSFSQGGYDNGLSSKGGSLSQFYSLPKRFFVVCTNK
jgi:hypothetical protein